MILGVESSCDESSVALLDEVSGKILVEIVASQVDMHALYGGVVPDLASRAHLDNFFPVLDQLESAAPGALNQLSKIVVTRGPGLAGCLALGMAFAKAIALAKRVPLVGVNHLRGHLFSPFIPVWSSNVREWPERYSERLPHMGLIVSGGNTILAHIDKAGKVEILAETVDDAAGEALDKGAKLLGMPYPGGPYIEKAASGGDLRWHPFPVASKSRNYRRFSFSGLKTSLRYFLEKHSAEEVDTHMADLCASYQHAVFQQLLKKMEQIFRERQNIRSLGLSGGVANNGTLRALLSDFADRSKVPLLMAERKHTGDNATMIAFAAIADPSGTVQEDQHDLSFEPAWQLA